MLLVNPCFNIYCITTLCPVLWDVLGFAGSRPDPPTAEIYFSLPSVQSALHVPPTKWVQCATTPVFPLGDSSRPSALCPILPRVIENSVRTVIAHGALDYVLLQEGTLLAIQNMTWGGAQGFTERPQEGFWVPYAGRGTAGKTRTERGLTWVGVDLAGHMVPQYQPAASLRMLEFLVGDVESLVE